MYAAEFTDRFDAQRFVDTHLLIQRRCSGSDRIVLGC